MDHTAGSQHSAKRTNDTFMAVKKNASIDCMSRHILEIHCSVKQSHDAKVTWQLLTRHLDERSVLTTDKDHEWELLRRKLRSDGVKPVIKYREFSWHGGPNNVLLDETAPHQRSTIESTVSRSGENAVRSCERERGSGKFVSSSSSGPSETSN